jgi:hypothetical protein
MTEKKEDEKPENNTPYKETDAEKKSAPSQQFSALEKATELLNKLEAKEKEITEREAALDKKLKEMDLRAAEAKIAGFGAMKPEPNKELEAEKSARGLIKGTGFEQYLPPLDEK